jgi:hypothetical protein
MREGVWTHGQDTSFEAWVAGKSRLVIVTRQAIEDYLRLDSKRAVSMSPKARRDLVIGNLAVMIAAASRKTDVLDEADAISYRKGKSRSPQRSRLWVAAVWRKIF